MAEIEVERVIEWFHVRLQSKADQRLTDQIAPLLMELRGAFQDEDASHDISAALPKVQRFLVRQWLEAEDLADALASAEGADSQSSHDADQAAREMRELVAQDIVRARQRPDYRASSR